MATQGEGLGLGLKYSRALNLSEVESKHDPESEPYRSKYAARELLKELKAEVGQWAQAGDSEDERAEQRLSQDGHWLQKLAVVELQLGLNHTETEELSAGEEHLAKCVRVLEPFKLSPAAVSIFIQAENQLGILWAGLEEMEKAQTYLEDAESLYNQYTKEQRYMEGRLCLAASTVIFNQAGGVSSECPVEESEEERERRDQLQQKKAEIARCWIKYCLNLLQDARKLLEDDIGELDWDRQEELKIQLKKEEEEKEQGRKSAVLFGSSDTFDLIQSVEEKVSCTYPEDFLKAREVFLVGQNYVQEAKEFFQLDDHVTDHIEVVQDHSALFKSLAFFEEDQERRCKMHKRRIDMLDTVYTELNPQYYLLVCRQLQFEIADTYYEMMELKVSIANRLDELDSHNIKKINHLAQSAIAYYNLFLDSLKNSDKMFPEKLETDVVRPALVGKFRIGWLYSKMITSDLKTQLENMQQSVDCYRFVVKYCETQPEAAKAMEPELELCAEMATLLPARMEKLKAKLLVIN
uniref:KIF-binding protein isoform X2 n=1 Tax=Pristiophorus japonicus TaxID=55135 RepID=UPI00398E8B10